MYGSIIIGTVFGTVSYIAVGGENYALGFAISLFAAVCGIGIATWATTR